MSKVKLVERHESEYPYYHVYCPKCNRLFGMKWWFEDHRNRHEKYNYCPTCGEKLDWSEVE